MTINEMANNSNGDDVELEASSNSDSAPGATITVQQNDRFERFEQTTASFSDIGKTSRLGSTPIERFLYFKSCFDPEIVDENLNIEWEFANKVWNIYTTFFVSIITFVIWFGSLALCFYWNLFSCFCNIFKGRYK